MSDFTLGCIGAGNMAEAILRGLLQTQTLPPAKLTATDILTDRLNALAKELGMKVCSTNTELVKRAHFVLLAIKPQQILSVLEEIRETLDGEKKIIISIAAGITTAVIEKALNKPVSVIRVMPNTPARILAGASAIARGQYASAQEAEQVQKIFSAIGLTVVIPEEQLDAVTALSGSGPAYIFRLCEILQNSGQTLGLSAETARMLAIQTIYGAGRMLKESQMAPEALRQAVTSKGGTTEAALAVLEAAQWDRIVQQAMLAARDRSQALSGQS
jgi:pyrroline-5-carboxylate reductase